MWTQFWDMHSGGGLKEKVGLIYIEAPMAEAKIIFYNRFGHNPERVSCTCCGEDYSINEHKTLRQATAYHRGCAYEGGKYVEMANRYGQPYQTLSEFKASGNAIIIAKADITKRERVGAVPQQGYVWQ